VRANPDVFEYKLKKDGGWSREKSYARWVSDVLIYHAGIALIRTDAFQITTVRTLDKTVLPSDGLGDHPSGVEVNYAGGETATFAVSAQDLDPRSAPNRPATPPISAAMCSPQRVRICAVACGSTKLAESVAVLVRLHTEHRHDDSAHDDTQCNRSGVPHRKARNCQTGDRDNPEPRCIARE
jgi:hypothetical protein